MSAVDFQPLDFLPAETETLWAVLEDTTRMRRAEIGDVADNLLSWTPNEGMHSIGAVMMHIIETEAQWIHEVLGGRKRSSEERAFQQADATDQWGGNWAPAPALSWSELLAYHDTIRLQSRTVVEALGEPEATSPLGNRLVTLRWVLKHVATHEAYHFGQIELLLQMARRSAAD
ncbi:MAG: DinB family protein [Armatimonadaceae bacterium]